MKIVALNYICLSNLLRSFTFIGFTGWAQFESNEFLLTQKKATHTQIHVARYNLTFSLTPETIIYDETGEQVREGTIWVLDDEGNETGYTLTSAHSAVFNQFESNEFLLTQKKATHTQIHVARYNLTFSLTPETIIYDETGEQVLEAVFPIAPAVAGLVLSHHEQARYLVPIARFYATDKESEVSDFYPVVHDIDGTIAQSCLEEHWRNHPPTQKPLWHYHHSEGHISYQLKEGQPIAENVADALYLAYIYLATNQPEKAWNTLEECNTRLGGLTGDPKELHYISWICNHLPHVLPSTKSEYEKVRL